MDSLSKGKITKNIEEKICTLLFCKEPVIKVVIKLVQQQANGVNCAVFAIAYVTSLVFGENPSLCSYNVPLMSQHLVNCLEKEMMNPFPKQDSTKRVLKCKKKKSAVTHYLLFMLFSMSLWKRKSNDWVYEILYCSCLSVCQYKRENPMVECMRCYEWFRQKCEKILRKMFTNKTVNFFCKAYC